MSVLWSKLALSSFLKAENESGWQQSSASSDHSQVCNEVREREK